MRTAADSVQVEQVFVTKIPPDADQKNVSVGCIRKWQLCFFTVIYIHENVAENMRQLLLCFFCQIDSNVKACRQKSSAALRRQLRSAADSVQVEQVFVTKIPPDADHRNHLIAPVRIISIVNSSRLFVVV